MKTYAFITRRDEVSSRIEDLIRSSLNEAGWEESLLAENIIVIGGDGTFLYAVHEYMDRLDDVFFYGIHTGTLGFYTDFKEDELDQFLEVFLTGRLRVEEYPLLECRVGNNIGFAINEMRIENAARTQIMHVEINGEFFETYRGTGLCVCTQLGSTAYNRSLRGAILQEGLNVIELSEISGIHHNKYRSLGSPLVLKDSTFITFKADDFKWALLGMDQKVLSLDNEHKVTVRVSPDRKVRVLRGKKVSYFDRLKSLF